MIISKVSGIKFWMKSEMCFLRGELQDKNEFAKTLFNPGSDNKNQQSIHRNQDRKPCLTKNESNTLLKKDDTNKNYKKTTGTTITRAKTITTPKTLHYQNKTKKIIVTATKNMRVILKIQTLLLKTEKQQAPP